MRSQRNPTQLRTSEVWKVAEACGKVEEGRGGLREGTGSGISLGFGFLGRRGWGLRVEG